MWGGYGLRGSLLPLVLDGEETRELLDENVE
jgi:hypothetical protein